MKKFLVLLLVGAALLACEKDDSIKLYDDYYYANGVRYPLTAMNTKYYMIFKTADKQVVIDALDAQGADFDTTKIYDYSRYIDRLGIDSDVKELADCSEWIVETGRSTTYKMIPELVYLAPHYRDSGGYELGITNILEVRSEGSDELEKLRSLAERYHFLILGQNPHDRSLYYLGCTKQTNGNALEMANLLYEAGAYEYAAADFIIESHPN